MIHIDRSKLSDEINQGYGSENGSKSGRPNLNGEDLYYTEIPKIQMLTL